MLVSKTILVAGATAAALSLAASANAEPVKNYHLFRPTSLAAVARQAPPPASDMNYYGGPVFSDVKVERHVE